MKARQIFEKAKQNHYAIGAFNVANIETLKAITGAAKKLNSPVLIEASDGEINYIGIKQLVALVRAYEEELNIPLILNLDHGKNFEMCKAAVDAGFDYVHIDASKLPYDENVEITKKVVEYAHAHDVMVEGEMDHIQGSSADHTKENPEDFAKPEFMTNPEKALKFVEDTGIDVLASFIGNLHGVYATEMHLNHEILKQLGEVLPNTYFSLHGGSGIYNDDVKKAVQMGIVKVNVNSEMRMAFKKALQDELNKTDEIAIYKIAQPAIDAVQQVVEDKIMVFGSENKALEEIESLF